jgi:hypothetical protein
MTSSWKRAIKFSKRIIYCYVSSNRAEKYAFSCLLLCVHIKHLLVTLVIFVAQVTWSKAGRMAANIYGSGIWRFVASNQIMTDR